MNDRVDATASSRRRDSPYASTATFAHDAAGRIEGESLTAHGQTYTIGRAYDPVGNLTQITYPDGTVVDRDFTERDQLDEVRRNSSLVASFVHDPGMRETSRTFGNGLTTSTNWRDDNQVSSIDNLAVGNHVYTYDANGNRTSETISGPMSGFGWATGTTGYDAEDRLINWNRADGNLNQAWDLSDVGNWDSLTTNSVTQNRSHSLAHELTAINTNPLTHDAKGNLTADDQGRSFTWDADNHLASATKASITSSYAYDALGRRVTKTTGTATTVFVSLTLPIPLLGIPGGRIIAEYTAGTAATSPLRETIYGSYVDESLAIIDGTTGGIHYYHQNARYDVVALSGVGGTIAERYAYDAYGNTLIFDGTGATQQTSSQYSNRYGFTGRELDEESGLYYFRARYYDSRLGRFVERDGAGYIDGLNLYVAYFVPRKTDASGHQALPLQLPVQAPKPSIEEPLPQNPFIGMPEPEPGVEDGPAKPSSLACSAEVAGFSTTIFEKPLPDSSSDCSETAIQFDSPKDFKLSNEPTSLVPFLAVCEGAQPVAGPPPLTPNALQCTVRYRCSSGKKCCPGEKTINRSEKRETINIPIPSTNVLCVFNMSFTAKVNTAITPGSCIDDECGCP